MLISLLHRSITFLSLTTFRLLQLFKISIPLGTFPLLLEVASSLAYCSIFWKHCELAYWLYHRLFLCSLVLDLDDNLKGSVYLIISSARRTPYLERRHPGAFLF